MERELCRIECEPEKMASLNRIIEQAELYGSRPTSRFDKGHTFDLEITGVFPATKGRARLRVESYAGSGFAGQAYKVELTGLDLKGEPIPGLEPGRRYALKIMIPESKFSYIFRNTIYWLAYQGPFSAQVNHAAARTGVLWQKLIRRGVGIRFGDELGATDTYATFFCLELGAYGEINEWIEGRDWQFEINPHLFNPGRDSAKGQSEYAAKKRFMADLVDLFHEMGAPELARQYEWWSMKSQPNVLKRVDAGSGPAQGLTAVDFRAGLALLLFLPMSPVDFRLIFQGLRRGDPVQFDRGDLKVLEGFIKKHKKHFSDMLPVLEELKTADPAYRSSLPDIFHHRLRIFFDPRLRSNIRNGLVQGYRATGLVDQEGAEKLKNSGIRFFFFYLLGIIPILGKRIRRLGGNKNYARHIGSFLTSPDYMRRTIRGYQAACLLKWHLAGKIGPKAIDFYLRHHLLFGLVRALPGTLPLPVSWTRFLVDWDFSKRLIRDATTHPVKFLRDRSYRNECISCDIDEALEDGLINTKGKAILLSQIEEPGLKSYLKGSAVHLATLPITPLTSLALVWYARIKYGLSFSEAVDSYAGLLFFFKFGPVSPGSITRFIYVIAVMIKKRNSRIETTR